MMDLLRAVFDPQAEMPLEPEAYRGALEDIDYYAVSPQVHAVLRRKGRLEQTPEPFRERLERLRREALYSLVLIKQQTDQLLEALERAGVEAIPLKGTRFAERVFGHFAARMTSDIDLLVKEADLTRAADCIKRLGFWIEEERIPGHFHWCFSKPLPGSPIPLTVELHWGLLKAGTSALRIDDLWREARPLAPYAFIKELSTLHEFYMICLHGWKHHLNSPKYFLDIMQLLETNEGQWELPELLQLARSHRTYRRIVSTLRIVIGQFPHLAGVLRLPAGGRPRKWEYEALRDSTQWSQNQYLQLLSFQFFHFDSRIHALRAFASWLLPTPLEASFELGRESDGLKPLPRYLKLYVKRCRGGWRALRKMLENKLQKWV